MTAAPPVVGLLRLAYAAARRRLDELAARTVTGRRWRRPPRQCPPWCARDHTCTARHGYPSGEHRSATATLSTPYGVLVGTRVQDVAGGARFELRAQVNLHPDEQRAGRQTGYLPVAVDLAIRTVLAQLAESDALAGVGREQLPTAAPASAVLTRSPWTDPPGQELVLTGEIVGPPHDVHSGPSAIACDVKTSRRRAA